MRFSIMRSLLIFYRRRRPSTRCLPGPNLPLEKPIAFATDLILELSLSAAYSDSMCNCFSEIFAKLALVSLIGLHPVFGD